MNIKLEKFRLTPSQSRETNCFSAIVCVGGSPAFVAANSGRGGGIRYTPLSLSTNDVGLLRKSLADLRAYAMTLPALDIGNGLTAPRGVDSLVDAAVDVAIEEREKAKFVRDRGLMLIVVESGRVKNLKVRGAITPELIRDYKMSHPGVQVLNELPADEAWAIAWKIVSEERGIQR